MDVEGAYNTSLIGSVKATIVVFIEILQIGEN